MKKIILSTLVFASVFTLGLTLSSNANGPGGNRTGSPGSSGNCGSCHSGGNFSGQLKVGIVEVGDTNFIANYTAGKAYELLVKIKGTSSKMGFQTTVINAAGAAIGTLGTPPTGTTKYASGTKTIWGHSTPSSTGVWRIGWTAPAAGSGDAITYSSCVLANSNNNDNGDQVVPASNTVKEAVSSKTTNFEANEIKLLGNPVKNEVKLNQTTLQMAVWNNEGQLVAKSFNSNACDVSKLSAGTYYLQIMTQNHTQKMMVISVN